MLTLRLASVSSALVVMLLLGAVAPPAPSATQLISTCGATCTTSCMLTQDLHCTAGDGVTVTVGSLDMRGFSIFCDPMSECGTAVKVTTSGTGVWSSISGANSSLEAGAPKIVGIWNYGVDCGNILDSSVTGITLQGFFALAAIRYCSQVEYNVISGLQFQNYEDITYPDVTNIGIFINGSSGDAARFVTNNYIDGAIKPIVRAANSPNVLWTITNNLINHRNYAPDLGQPAAITLVSPQAQQETVIGNIVTGDGTGVMALSANHSGTYSGNLCRFPLVGCGACITSGKCLQQGTVHSPL